MFPNERSPLEYLAAFALSFAAGVATTAALAAYAKFARKQASGEKQSNTKNTGA